MGFGKRLKKIAKKVVKVAKKAAPYAALAYGGYAAYGAYSAAGAAGGAAGGGGSLFSAGNLGGWLKAGQGAMDIVGGVTGAAAEKEAAGAARDIEMANAGLSKAEADESISRTAEQQRMREGSASAQTGASGFAIGSSLDQYLNTMKKEHSTDIDWMRTARDSQYGLSQAEASARYSASKDAAKATKYKGFGDATKSFGSAYLSFKR